MGLVSCRSLVLPSKQDTCRSGHPTFRGVTTDSGDGRQAKKRVLRAQSSWVVAAGALALPPLIVTERRLVRASEELFGMTASSFPILGDRARDDKRRFGQDLGARRIPEGQALGAGLEPDAQGDSLSAGVHQNR